MRLKTQLAIKADIEALLPRAWNRRDIELYLAERRADWNAPKYLTPGLLITFLVDNKIAQVAEITSKEYGRKARYVTGDLSILQIACSFYKNSYASSSGTPCIDIGGGSKECGLVVIHQCVIFAAASSLVARGAMIERLLRRLCVRLLAMPDLQDRLLDGAAERKRQPPGQLRLEPCIRSEEHTSELQS